MFEAFKVVQAKNRVIIDLVGNGFLDKRSGDLMREIAGNDANRQYATVALKQRLVKCKYTAAAAVFARLAVYYAKEPSGELTDGQWRLACARALGLAGASPEQTEVAMRELISMNERVENQPLL